MADGNTAADRLLRVLHILPRASDRWVSYEELAGELEVTPETIRRDLEEAYARAFYLPPGPADAIQIEMEADRVSVWTKGQFRRPLRLSPREAAALGLGLRVLAAQSPAARRTRLQALARTLEARLATAPAGDLDASLAYDAEVTDPAEIRPVLQEATVTRRPCRIRYLKPGDAEATERVVEPYAVVHARGAWYVLAWCRSREAVLAFRIDRVLAALPEEGTFDPPADFDPGRYLDAGRVYRADEDVEVTVRYSPRVARWFLERGEGREEADGSVVVPYRVADPHWIVSHVLTYGPDAVVLEPEWARERVLEAARAVRDGAGVPVS